MGGVVHRYNEAWEYNAVVYREAEYVLHNEFGEPLTYEDFADLIPDRLPQWWLRRYAHWNGTGPVPGTGKAKASGWRWLRQIRTQSERRQNALVLREEGEVPPRGARKPVQIPTAWEDLQRQRQRCWKAQRRTQWRG